MHYRLLPRKVHILLSALTIWRRVNITLKVLLGLGEQVATGFAPSGNILSCFLIKVVLIGFLLGNRFQERHPVARYGRTWPVESRRGYGVTYLCKKMRNIWLWELLLSTPQSCPTSSHIMKLGGTKFAWPIQGPPKARTMSNFDHCLFNCAGVVVYGWVRAHVRVHACMCIWVHVCTCVYVCMHVCVPCVRVWVCVHMWGGWVCSCSAHEDYHSWALFTHYSHALFIYTLHGHCSLLCYQDEQSVVI